MENNYSMQQERKKHPQYMFGLGKISYDMMEPMILHSFENDTI